MPSLSMPLFVRPADVILRMQLGSELSGLTEVLESGIIGAQLHLQRITGSKLQRRSHDCYYFLDKDAFSGIQPGGLFRLELPSGCVRLDTPVVLTASSVQTSQTGPFLTYTAMDPTLVRVDYDRGYVLVDAPTYANCYVRVQCDTGFEDGTRPWPVEGVSAYDPETPYTVGMKVVANESVWRCIAVYSPPVAPPDLTGWEPLYVEMEQIPIEFYEAIMGLVPMVFNASQVTNRNEEAEKQYTTNADHAALLLQPYVRTKGFSFRPLWTS